MGGAPVDVELDLGAGVGVREAQLGAAQVAVLQPLDVARCPAIRRQRPPTEWARRGRGDKARGSRRGCSDRRVSDVEDKAVPK